jgi:hypothetical protein
MRTLLVAIGLLFGFAALLQAGPLDQRQVAAEAKWLVHVDLDAAREGKVCKAIFEHGKGKRYLRAIHHALGLDPSKEIHGMLLYGAQFTYKRGVTIVQVDVDAERLTAFLKKMPDYKTTRHGKHTLHTWTRKGHGQTSMTACSPGKVIVLGRNGSDVKAALDVLDGRAAGLADGDSPLAGPAFRDKTVAGRVVFQVRAVGLAGPDVPFKSPIVRQSESLVMVVGEREGQAFARARLTAKSDEVARLMLSVIEGRLANERLEYGDDEEAKKVLQALVVAVDGKAVTLEWKGSLDSVWRFVGKRMAKHHIGKQRNGKHYNGKQRNGKQRDSKHRDSKHRDGKPEPK